MKKWNQCEHENLYSQRLWPYDPGPIPGQPNRNGLIQVPGRTDIEVDYCQDCNYWLYEGMAFLTIMNVVGYVDAVNG